MTIKSAALAIALSLLSSVALAAGTIKSGHVLGNPTSAERTPQDTAVVPVIQQSGSGAGTGVGTALGVNVGTAGSIVVNGGALGTPSSGTLTNATGLPPTGLAVPSAVQTALGITPNTTGGFLTSAGNQINVTLPPYNASPSNSASANATAFQSAFTAAASGGQVYIPCGSYAINATPSVTIAHAHHVSIFGVAKDCVYLNFQGAVNGPTALLADGTASVDMQGFTPTTNTAGGQRAVDIELTNGTGSAYGPTNYVDLNIIPADMYNTATAGAFQIGTAYIITSVGSTNFTAIGASSNTVGVVFTATGVGSGTGTASAASADYWGSGVYEVGINNLEIDGSCSGANLAASLASGAQRTDCQVLQGSGVGGNLAPGAYSVIINTKNYIANNCASFQKINDFVQGAANLNPNFTSCARGVYQALPTPVGYETEFQTTGGQGFATLFNFDFESPTTAGIQIDNMQIAGTGTLIKIQGGQYNIHGNNIACTTINGPTAINIANGLYTSNSWTGAISNGSGGAGTQLVVTNFVTGDTPIAAGSTLVYGVGGGVSAGTEITAFVSGTNGGNGTYTVNNSQLVAAQAMVGQQPASGQGGKINDNNLLSCNYGVTVAANSSPNVSITNNHPVGIGYSSFTSKIDNGSGSAGTTLAISSYPSNTPCPSVGTFINGASVSTATKITAIGSLTNCVGTYTVNNSQLTPASGTETMTSQWLTAGPFDYSAPSTATNVTITDHETRLFTDLPSACPGILGSHFDVFDLVATTFHQAVTAGAGSGAGHVLCAPGGWILD